MKFRPYFFEIFVAANFVLIQLLLLGNTTGPVATLPMLFGVAAGLFVQMAVAIVARGLYAWWRRDPTYLATLRTPEWIGDTLRILFFASLLVHTYGWIKLAIPRLHPRLFDAELWSIDQALFFGHSPTVFFLNLFSNPPAVARAIDWMYANIFVTSIIVTFGYFLSDARREVRVAFTNGNALMWMTGAWLYVAIPSLGPAFRFPDVWLPFAAMLPTTSNLQTLLFHQYQQFSRLPRLWVTEGVDLMLGTAAFPSLHVAFQTYVALWMRKVWRVGEVLFVIFALFIFIGSIVTGWHYLIDAIAGLVLAAGCYWGSMLLNVAWPPPLASSSQQEPPTLPASS